MDDIMKPHFKKEYGEAEVKKLEQHVDRLESIKERLELGKKHDTKYSIPNDQVEYLLQRLERYETALQQIKYDYEQSLDHDITMKNMYREATAALKEP